MYKLKNIKIIVATHKEYKMPQDSIYLPVQVGCEGKQKLEYQPDNEGENISTKNPFFCELTGMYWAWKNLDAEYVGLVHYRRHFSVKGCHKRNVNEKIQKILNREEVEKLLENTDIILPKKRNYYIENLYSHYAHTLYVEPLDEAGKIIAERHPEYSKELENLHKRRSAHMFNMFIMKKELFDRYCEWLFDILFELEKRTDVSQYDSFHDRFIGRVSELLLDVWINKNGYKYKEVNLLEMEKVNWLKKGCSFLEAKFTGKKYDKSF